MPKDLKEIISETKHFTFDAPTLCSARVSLEAVQDEEFEIFKRNYKPDYSKLRSKEGLYYIENFGYGKCILDEMAYTLKLPELNMNAILITGLYRFISEEFRTEEIPIFTLDYNGSCRYFVDSVEYLESDFYDFMRQQYKPELVIEQLLSRGESLLLEKELIETPPGKVLKL